MADSRIWLVDHIAAKNLVRDLGLTLDDDALMVVSERLAEHRLNAFDFAATRMLSKIEDAVQRLIGPSSPYRSPDWSDGCRSAETVISNVVSAVHREIGPSERRSKGQILRGMLQHAGKQAAADRRYQVIDVPAPAVS